MSILRVRFHTYWKVHLGCSSASHKQHLHVSIHWETCHFTYVHKSPLWETSQKPSDIYFICTLVCWDHHLYNSDLTNSRGKQASLNSCWVPFLWRRCPSEIENKNSILVIQRSVHWSTSNWIPFTIMIHFSAKGTNLLLVAQS